MKLSSILKDYPVLSVSDRPIAEAFLSGQMEQQIHSIDYDSCRFSVLLPARRSCGRTPLRAACLCRRLPCFCMQP